MLFYNLNPEKANISSHYLQISGVVVVTLGGGSFVIFHEKTSSSSFSMASWNSFPIYNLESSYIL